jgi:hypothetical protein
MDRQSVQWILPIREMTVFNLVALDIQANICMLFWDAWKVVTRLTSIALPSLFKSWKLVKRNQN